MKNIFFTLLILLLLLLSACTKGNTDYEKITFSTWGSKSEIATVKSLINKFEKENPDIKVELIHVPDNYFQKLHLLIASNLAPDVMFVNNLNSRIYIDAGKFEPLNDYLNSSEKLSQSDFVPKALEPMTYNGSVYAVPRDVSNMLIYYNKAIFDKYSVPYPDNNWTKEDFFKTAISLTKDTNNDGKTDIFGFGFEKNSLFWLPFLLSDGGGIISYDEKEIILGEKNSIDALQFYIDLRNKYHVAPKADEQASLTTSQLFMQGKVAMHLCGRWCSLTYKNNADFDWDVVTFPKFKKGSVTGLDASGWAISSSSENKKAAWKFVEFMASDESSSFITKDGLIFPANKAASHSVEFTNPPPKNIQAFYDTLKNSRSTPLCIKYSEINDMLHERLEPVFDGKITAEKALDKEFINRLKTKTD